MSDFGEAFPLSWPTGKPRTHYRKPSHFRHGVDRVPLHVGVQRLKRELALLGARDVVISSNLKPRSLQAAADSDARADPGVAVYFRVEDQPHCLACDRWTTVADNLSAVAAHVEALRGQARWGVGDLLQALGGYRALPAMGQALPWWQVLAFEQPPRDKAEAEARYYELLKKHHPDRGGNGNQAAEVTSAWLDAERFYAQEAR